MKKQERILIVEDEMIISATIEETLNRIGYRNIECAFDAETALEKMEHNDYDVILMDVKLGGNMDGIDVVTTIKKKKEIVVVFVTGNSDDKTVMKARATLPSGFIIKPVTENNLKIQLDLLLYREHQKKNEVDESAIIKNLYEGDCSGLKIVINSDGVIVGLSPQIRKITGIPAYQYISKNFATVGWEENLYKLVRRILNEARLSEKRTYYGSIYSPFIGERLVTVTANSCGPQTFEFEFFDITNSVKEDSSRGRTIDLALATNNADIMKGFSSLSAIVINARIAAQLPDAKALNEFVKVFDAGVLMMDVNMNGLHDVLKLLKDKPLVKKVLLASPIIEKMKLESYDPMLFDACVSKSADDATLVEMLQSLHQNQRYEDKAFERSLTGLTGAIGA